MTKQIKVILTEEELSRLNQIAARECRRSTDHARFLIVSALSNTVSEMSKPATVSNLAERNGNGFGIVNPS